MLIHKLLNVVEKISFARLSCIFLSARWQVYSDLVNIDLQLVAYLLCYYSPPCSILAFTP